MGHLCDARSELSGSPQAVGTLRGVADCLCGSWQWSNRPWLLQAAGTEHWIRCTIWQVRSGAILYEPILHEPQSHAEHQFASVTAAKGMACRTWHTIGGKCGGGRYPTGGGPCGVTGGP